MEEGVAADAETDEVRGGVADHRAGEGARTTSRNPRWLGSGTCQR